MGRCEPVPLSQRIARVGAAVIGPVVARYIKAQRDRLAPLAMPLPEVSKLRLRRHFRTQGVWRADLRVPDFLARVTALQIVFIEDGFGDTVGWPVVLSRVVLIEFDRRYSAGADICASPRAGGGPEFPANSKIRIFHHF